MSRFVRPETKTLTLANGDTLIVKKRLSNGEQRAALARMYLAASNGTLKINPLHMGMARTTAFLLDWSLTDDDGKPVVIRGLSVDDLTAVLDSLSPEDFSEISQALEAHEEAMAKERAEEKERPFGKTTSEAISPSPSEPASASMKSEVLM